MSKTVLLFAIVVLVFVTVEAQTRRPINRQICQRQNERCLRNEPRNGRNNDISEIFNQWCRGSNPRWRNISRCELTRATCRLTLENCATLSCENVRRALREERTTTTRRPGPREE
ncbi:uncharacterized protein LOC110179990 [Drosophila serrata]|uniref:uncharacterized protein LOC110179990 n=1 Tax=Drosophila serrata TaxID=7274 RepID=UPI000A1D16E5|nr:uncharacterized protein LOC110179990 [Drosophila serrata]